MFVRAWKDRSLIEINMSNATHGSGERFIDVPAAQVPALIAQLEAAVKFREEVDTNYQYFEVV